MSFTDEKPRVVTKERYPGNWGGYKDGRKFRCSMCGHYFKIGDIFRWVMGTRKGVLNLMVCEKCDGPDILDRWVERVKEYEDNKDKFWWAHDD